MFNRSVTNRVFGRIAGWMPGFAIVHHTGRRSGNAYHTPVNAFRTEDGYRIALTYGSGSDWVRNVLAAGGCEIETRRTRIALAQPRIVPDPDHRWAPPGVRQILSVLVDVPESLLLSRADSART